MKKLSIKYPVLLISLAALITGAVMQYRFLKNVRSFENDVRKKMEITVELEGMRSELRKIDAAKELFSYLTNAVPGPLTGIIGKNMPGVRPDDTRPGRREIADGWILHEQEIVFPDVAFADVMSFLKEAEGLRPPWMLKTCLFKTGSRPGTGKVTICLVAVEHAVK